MSLLVSSCHPANAGLQAALTVTLLDFGASVDGVGDTRWRSPLVTALVFGYFDTAATLARRGARIGNIAAAAGLGRLDDVKRLLPAADPDSRHRALALSAQLGHADVVRALLDAGKILSATTPKDSTHTRRRCTRRRSPAATQWSGCWSNEARGWISEIRFIRARRSAGPDGRTDRDREIPRQRDTGLSLCAF